MENENITQGIPEVPEQKTRQLPLNKFTIGGAAILAIVLIAIGAASAGGTPEPEVKTITKTVTEEVPGETVYELSSTCRKALVQATQSMVDQNQLFIHLADAAASLSNSKVQDVLAEQEGTNKRMVEAGTQVALCDSSIGDDVDFKQ